jgi:hypothetical protein
MGICCASIGIASASASAIASSASSASGVGGADSASSATEHSFQIRLNTLHNIRTHAPLISNSSDDDIWYFALVRRRLVANDGLPPLRPCGMSRLFAVLTRAL